jgi:2'-5' RNA ligase
MTRYFVAIPLPEDAKDLLVAVQPPAIAGMRLIGRDEMHLTLHFLGEVAAHDVQSVCTALVRVRMNAFQIALKGIGQFPPEGAAQVLWAGIEPSADLIDLHRAVGTALKDAIGFRPEARAYAPHVTLARINELVPPDIIDGYLIENQGLAVPSVLLDRFSLYSSTFVEYVPHYQEEAMFPLRSYEWSEIEQRPWSEIVGLYRSLVTDETSALAPMLRFAEQIAACEYASMLFAYTSMSTMCIQRTRTIRRSHEELRVTYDARDRQFHFEYWSHEYVKQGPWKRSCSESEGFATLERILLKRLRWFKKESMSESERNV